MLTIVLNKGRILEALQPLLAAADIEPIKPLQHSRELLFDTKKSGVRLFVSRSADVPTFVGRGVADIGITGKDTLLETDTSHFYEPLDLEIARCRLVCATPVGADTRRSACIRVATKYVNCARHFYAKKRQQAEIIKLSGAIELAPLIGLADEIVDLVDTGSTLKANGLVEKETIAHISARVIVNKAAMKRRFLEISELLNALQRAVDDG